jgi:thiol-disulfide isomerase/thioredoxin
MAESKDQKNYGTIILVGLVAVAAFLGGIYFTGHRSTQTTSASPTPGATSAPTGQAKVSPTNTTLGNFIVTGDQLCATGNKPIVYFFGSTTCPHCQWEHPIMQKITAEFSSVISYHDNQDNNTTDQDIWNKYASINGGAIPFIVVGCQYARVGSGEAVGQATEEQNLTALFCKVTGGKPDKVCSAVKDLVSQIAN